jgi:hypothetical protein
MTLLTVCQNAAAEIGIDMPAYIIGNTDAAAQQLQALTRRSVREIGKMGWPQTITEYTFNTVVGTASYDFPADFLGMVDQTPWDRANRWPLQGPLEPQEWQVLKSGLAASGIRLAFRVWQGKLWLDPTPAAIAEVAFEYFSNLFVRDSLAVPKGSFTADTDYAAIDEDLIELDLIWRFKRQKGFDYMEDYHTAQNAISRDRGRLMGGRVLPLSYPRGFGFGSGTVPETGFGP